MRVLNVLNQNHTQGAVNSMFYPCHASFEQTGCCLAPSVAALVGVLRIVPSPTDRAAIHLRKKGNATLHWCLNTLIQRSRFSLVKTFKFAALTSSTVCGNKQAVTEIYLTALTILTSDKCLKIGEMKWKEAKMPWGWCHALFVPKWHIRGM